MAFNISAFLSSSSFSLLFSLLSLSLSSSTFHYVCIPSFSVFFYDPPNEVGGSLCFCLVRPASVRPGGKKKYGLKTRFRGFWVCFGCFWRFRLLSVRPSVRAVDGLWFVQRTCPRGFRFRTWNQFEMNEYILKLCTSYFLDVRLDRRSVWERSELRLFNM